MDRERQIALINSAEERTEGYLRALIRVPKIKAFLHRGRPVAADADKTEQARKRA